MINTNHSTKVILRGSAGREVDMVLDLSPSSTRLEAAAGGPFRSTP